MRVVIVLLAAATLLTHDGWPLIAAQFANPARAAEEVFYISRGLLGLALFGAVLYLAGERVPLALLAVCVYGAAQESLTAICGAAYVWQTGVGKHSNDRSAHLCDAASDWSWIVMFVAFLTLAMTRMKRRED